MQYHRNARTNIYQREQMRQSSVPARGLVSQYAVSHVTISKWKGREDTLDRSSRPNTIHYAVDKSFWRIIKYVRKKTHFTLDDLVDSLLPYVPNLNRDNCWRILKVYRLNRLSFQEQEERKRFATYKPGFVHIDVFYLPKIGPNGQKKRTYCYVAIDRVTRLLFLEVYDKKDHYAAADFVMKCLNFFPFRIHHILTDNGREFTLKSARNRWGKVYTDSLFDCICQIAGIKHKLTKVKHPWTNGMAERAVRTVKDHTVKIHSYQEIPQAIKDIKVFQDYHNLYRKQRVINGKTPYALTMEWFVKEQKIFIKNPTDLLEDCKQPHAT